jgi:hypothetical protein
MKKPNIKIGDCFSIPLQDGRKAVGQYIFLDDRKPYGCGSLIRVFDLITREGVKVEQLKSAGLLFPPVFVGLYASIRSGRWRVIGSFPVENFQYPKFRCSNGHKPGKYYDWSIFDGQKMIDIGELTPEYRSLEMLGGWGDELLEDRIVTGKCLEDEIL